MPTQVVHVREPYDVYIGRAGHGHGGYFGNPFRLHSESERQTVLGYYREWFLSRVEAEPEFRRRVLALRGKVLGCFCKPKPCHGDVIAEWVDAQPEAAQAQPTVPPAPRLGRVETKKKRAKASATTYYCPRCQAQYPRPRGAGVCPVCQMQSNLTVALEPLEEPK